ncbi:MAG: hypothetical protein ACM3SX_06115 [Deltaproteobacteria bacterium]
MLSMFGALAAAEPPTSAAPPCDGKVVTSIAITPRDPSFLAVPRQVRAVARAIGVLHTTSTEHTISRFLLVEVGQPCTEKHRAESERILRLQPFLADATVRAVPDGDGVHIDVETIDEIPTVVDMRVRDGRASQFRFGNGNVGGQGLYLAGSVERGLAYRTGFAAHGVANQIFGRPYMLAVVAERAPLGGELTVAFGHAFVTDLQRNAWHVGISDENRYVSFNPPDGDAQSLEVRRRFWDLGGVRRVGIGRRTAFVGTLVTYEDVTPASRLVVVTDSGLLAIRGSSFADSVSPYRSLRLNGVAGVRALSFTPARGFDALAATQDVAVGAQVGALIGRSVPRFDSHDDDVLVEADFYAGLGSATSFAAVRMDGEARDDRRAGSWDSMIGSGRLAWYVKPAAAHVVISSLEFSGGHGERVPFQLMLGDRQGGVRGYSDSRDGGAVRGVARVEERWSIGGFSQHDRLGLAGFADAGRVWAGDAPFGVNSSAKIGLGVGLLAAFPPQSQRMWRLDVAVPVSPDAHARWDVRLTGTWTRRFWREPDDVARGRSGAAPSTIFTWP